MTQASAPDGTELLEVVQVGVNKQATISQIKTYVVNTLTTSNVPEGSNQYFTQARVLATPLTGLSISGGAVVATDTVLVAIGKLQNQANDRVDLSTNQITIAGNKSWTGKHLFGSSGLALAAGGNASLTQLLGEMVQFKLDQNNASYIAVHNATNNTASSAQIVFQAGSSTLGAALQLGHYAPSFSSSGIQQAGKGVLMAVNGVSGLNIGTLGSAPLQFWVAAVLRAQFFSTGTFVSTVDLVVDSGTKGLVLKDTQSTPHYWRVTVSNAGALVITDIGTSIP